MNNLFNPTDVANILERIEKLTPAAQRQWGKMTVAQMLAHCTASLQTAMGLDHPQKLPFFLRLIGKLLKKSFFSEKPYPKNSATDKSYIITGDRDFEKEKTTVIKLIKTFAAGGAEKCNRQPHVFFGQLTPEQWAIMQWKHFDHHLRQFGA